MSENGTADDRPVDRDGGAAGLRIAPGCYAAGDGLSNRLDDYLGERPDLSTATVLAGESALSAARDGIERSLDAAGVEFSVDAFEGECSAERVEAHRDRVEAEDPDLLLGVGGGKALDTAKLVAEGRCPVATVPTVASTCAAWTALSVLYEEDGSYVGPVGLSRCPDWVFLDTRVVAEAPARLLASGVMDATAKYLETAHIPPGATNEPARWATALARESCHARLREDGLEAVELCERNELSGTVSDVVEASVAGPGVAAGLLGEQPHLLLGHLLAYSLLDYDGVKGRSYHGERVAFGVLVFELLAGETPSAVAELKAWYEALGIELTLGRLGVRDVDERTVTDLAAAIDWKANYELVEEAFTPGEISDAIAAIEGM
jgi:glycerol dehydrogenase